MKIDLDDQSEVLGTFVIRKHGVVSGLSKFIGRDVLIILLPKGRQDPRIVAKEKKHVKKELT